MYLSFGTGWLIILVCFLLCVHLTSLLECTIETRLVEVPICWKWNILTVCMKLWKHFW
jgi:hypothetical protein